MFAIYTDFLIILALALLLMLAVWFLLQRPRSRQTQAARVPDKSQAPPRPGSSIQRLARRICRLLGFTVLAIVVIGGGVMFYENYRTMLRETAPAPSQVEIPDDLPFMVEEVTFPGGDGVRLAGWFASTQNGATVILLHGYGGNRLGTRWYAEKLVAAGYGVLMYDERASGESGGERRSYGWEDAPDVGGALAYLQERREVEADKIGIAGCSMGGGIALQGAARYPQIAAVWADGPSTIRAIDLPRPFNWATAVANTSNFMLDWLFTLYLGIEAPAPMIEIIPDIAPRPLMLVGGGKPHPYYGSEARRVKRYADFAGENAQVWVIPEAYHCDGPQQRPEAYEERLLAFFDRAFGLSDD